MSSGSLNFVRIPRFSLNSFIVENIRQQLPIHGLTLVAVSTSHGKKDYDQNNLVRPWLCLICPATKLHLNQSRSTVNDISERVKTLLSTNQVNSKLRLTE